MSDSSNITGRPWGNVASYTDAEWHEIYASLFDGSGNRGPLLFSTDDDFLVTQTNPASMNVQVATGTAIVGGLWGQSESAVTLAVAAAGGVDRYDLVFLHWLRGNQDLRIRVVDGTAATCAAAVAPATNAIATYQAAGPPVTEWAVPIACIKVGAGVGNIADADITDLREFSRFRTAAGDIADGTSVTTQVVAGLVPAMTDTGAQLVLAADGVGVDEISSAIAGDALTGGSGSALDVVPGTGLELNGDILQIAASAAGDGLSGGAGAALDVNVDAATIVIALDTLGVGTTIDHTYITNPTDVRQFISAAKMMPSVGSAVTWGTLAGLPVPSEGWLFPNGANNYVGFHAKVPIGYWPTSPYPPPLTFVWSHVNAGGAATCLWRMYYASTAGGPPWTYNCGDSIATTHNGSVTASVVAADTGKRLCTPTVEYLYYLESGEAYMDFTVGRVGAADTYGAGVLLLGVYIASKRDM